MKIQGSYTIRAPQQATWDHLTNPDAIAKCLPGVEKLNQVGPDEYTMSMTVGIGPVRGTYEGKVRLLNVHPPSDYQMEIEGSGRPGFVKGLGTLRLVPAGENQTQIEYDGDVEVGGPVAGVAQRMMGSVAKRLIEQFLSCIEQQITSQG
ncbi:CoxG family protein [Thermorudis peleae]|uniref:CoxG family protein n=1 Tax=Thermorudis peleae TaxID=1382356 RepID=UPI00056F27B6|nr:carbon monoxide dehydrogenase subunit G [Thermorudis peleae]MBX6753138.1 carbon monoxide dehydrogenase subunit G [Thermorudis peleae]